MTFLKAILLTSLSSYEPTNIMFVQQIFEMNCVYYMRNTLRVNEWKSRHFFHIFIWKIILAAYLYK